MRNLRVRIENISFFLFFYRTTHFHRRTVDERVSRVVVASAREYVGPITTRWQIFLPPNFQTYRAVPGDLTGQPLSNAAITREQASSTLQQLALIDQRADRVFFPDRLCADGVHWLCSRTDRLT